MDLCVLTDYEVAMAYQETVINIFLMVIFIRVCPVESIRYKMIQFVSKGKYSVWRSSRNLEQSGEDDIAQLF